MRSFVLIFLFVCLSYQDHLGTTTTPWGLGLFWTTATPRVPGLITPCKDARRWCSVRVCGNPKSQRFCRKTCNLCKKVKVITESPPPVSHPCARPCIQGQLMECSYSFTVETFKSMDSRFCGDCPFKKSDCFNKGCISADGVSRLVTVVNRQIPGPVINVCEGDTIKVNVKNRMVNGEGITIHWHGQFQNNSQWMDGVPMVTQCPIPLMSSMQYKFQAMPSGTHWWHSHVGLQRGDGFFGAIVVRQPKTKDIHNRYVDIDEESHVIVIDDWFHQTATQQFYESEVENVKEPKKYGLIINGRGLGKVFKRNNKIYQTPPSVFEVIQGKRHRFRLLNSATSNCPMEISIDQHKLIAIASDGRDIKPVSVDSINSMNGERYDFIVDANRPKGVYKIWLRGSGSDCANYSQTAVLKYKGASFYDLRQIRNPIRTSKSVLNPYSPDPRIQYKITDLVSISKTQFIPKDLSKTPDNVYFYELGFARASDKTIKAYINHYSWVWPDRPVMFKSKELDPREFCYKGSFQQKNTKLKSCVQRVKIPSNQTVDFVVYSFGTHPVHLHGGYYAVVAQIPIKGPITLDNVQKQYYEHRKSGKGFNIKNPPIKDTTMSKGEFFTVFRLRTWNPGYWLFHCHIDFHFKLGMGIVVDIGADSEWSAPPNGFPEGCKSYPEKAINF